MADVKITNDQYKAGFIIYVTGKIAPPGPGSSVKAMSLVSSAMKNQKQSLGAPFWYFVSLFTCYFGCHLSENWLVIYLLRYRDKKKAADQ